jgi:hypothetical protein
MKGFILGTSIAIATSVLGTTAEAGSKHHGHHGHHGHGHHAVHRHTLPYYGWQPRVYASPIAPLYRPQIYHDTTHYDYHPTTVYRHGNHYHVQPGHYDLHRSGHWHY